MEKREHILETAIRRFAHFGVQKTTLTEIADDLGITKQALAYYFSDKQSLIIAVEELILNEFFGSVTAHFAGAGSAVQALMELAVVKQEFFEKYAMLMQAAASEGLHQHARVDESKQKARVHMVGLIAAVLEQGVKTGELKEMNADETAALLYDTMYAFEYCAVGRQVVPDPKTITELFAKQKAVIELMVKGLRGEVWKN